MGFNASNAMPPATIWLVPVKGGEPKQLTQAGNPPGGHGAPSFSPNGKRIVFDSSDVTTGAIWSVSTDGGDLKQIFGRASDPVYTPDGRSIFIIAALAGRGRSLQKINLSDTGEPIGEPDKIFDASGSSIRQISIDAKGKRIVYSSLSTSSNIGATSINPNTTEGINNPTLLTQNVSIRNVYPAFSPDGRKIAYQTYSTGIGGQIWMMDSDGKNNTQLTTVDALNPWWFPDGKQIIFRSETDNRVVLWSVTVEGAKEKQLFEFDGDASAPRISPDGKQVAFNSKRSGTLNVWLVPIEGGQPKQSTFEKEMGGFPSWSPDGKWIAFQIKRGEDTNVAVMPSEGGEPIQLTFDKGQSWVYDWSPDGEKILFAGQREGIWNVYSVSRSTREEKKLTNFTKFNSYVRYPAWSPLNDKIVYEYAETTGNIWMIELK